MLHKQPLSVKTSKPSTATASTKKSFIKTVTRDHKVAICPNSTNSYRTERLNDENSRKSITYSNEVKKTTDPVGHAPGPTSSPHRWTKDVVLAPDRRNLLQQLSIVEVITNRIFDFTYGYQLDAERASYLYHVTESEESLQSILRNGFILNQGTIVRLDGPLAWINAPHGIFFSATLLNGQLPFTTSYPRQKGSVPWTNKVFPRISLRVESLCLESDYFMFIVKEPVEIGTTVTVLIAFIHKTNESALQWTLNTNMVCINTRENDCLQFLNNSNQWYCASYHQLYGKPNVWMNVFVVPAVGDRLKAQVDIAVIDYVKHV